MLHQIVQQKNVVATYYTELKIFFGFDNEQCYVLVSKCNIN